MSERVEQCEGKSNADKYVFHDNFENFEESSRDKLFFFYVDKRNSLNF